MTLSLLCGLESDLLRHIVSFACNNHRVLCICAQASSQLRTEAMFIIKSRYADESVLIESIIEKLRLRDYILATNPRVGTSLDLTKLKSVEWLGCMLGWVDGEESNTDHENLISDAFYCDCPNCTRTLPRRHLSKHEESLLNSHFLIKWWDEWSFYSVKNLR